MNIVYKDLLPASNTCDHNNVRWETTEPRGETHIEVSVTCRGCPASVRNVRIEKD